MFLGLLLGVLTEYRINSCDLSIKTHVMAKRNLDRSKELYRGVYISNVLISILPICISGD